MSQVWPCSAQGLGGKKFYGHRVVCFSDATFFVHLVQVVLVLGFKNRWIVAIILSTCFASIQLPSFELYGNVADVRLQGMARRLSC